MTTLPREPARRERPGPALWFGLLGGAGAWAVQFLVGYLVTESMCVAASSGDGGVITGSVVAVIVVSVVAFGVAVAATLAGRRVWQQGRERGEVPSGGTGWTGLAGMLLSGTFAFIILAQVLPLFLAGGCA